MKNTTGKTAFFSLIIILAAQLNMNLFITDFKISIAVICFPAFLFLFDSFSLIPVTFFSTIGIFASRIILYWFETGEISGAVKSYFPEMIFYVCYGLLLYLYTHVLPGKQPDKNHALLPLIVVDYASNLTELICRVQTDAFTIKTQTGIILVAVMRTAVIWCILTIFDQYKLLLLNKEHEERYKRLVLLISKLNGEVVWMKKNTALIEDTMSTSYRLFEHLKSSCADSKLTASALAVAKDIHEIKKEYLLIMRGISEALEQELENDGMYLDDILLLLKDAVTLNAKEFGRELQFYSEYQNRLYTDKHYAFMSVFRNLFVNAVEASDNSKVQITVLQTADKDSYIFSITDNGPGIPADNLDEVFETGFSTKINYTTGEVNRGLGLNLVQDIVESQFHGHLSLVSEPGRTTFTISIPKNELEVVS